MNDQHDEEYVDQKHFRYFTMAKSEQDTRNDNNIGYTHAVVQITKLFLPWSPPTANPRPLCPARAVQGPEMDNKIKLLDINLSGHCVCHRRRRSQTRKVNSNYKQWTTHTYECASVCVCVLLATRRAQCALCAPLSASNNDNGLESSQNTHSHTHTQTTSPLDNRATQ